MKRFYLAEILNTSFSLNSQVLIYSDFESNRLKYTLELVFEQLLGIKFSFCKDLEISNIIFSETQCSENAVNIPVCSQLLSEKGFEPFEVSYKYSGEKTILFPKEKEQDNIWNFDLFSAVFYLVSRYEEYKGFTPDIHNRFPAEASILYKTDSFEFPLVNNWVKKLKEELLQKFPNLKFNEPQFRFISTIDIDSTFRYKGKGILRTLGGLIRDMSSLNFTDVYDRLKTIAGLKHDSFDVFEKLNSLHTKNKTEVIFFWLIGNRSKFDKNISPNNYKQKNFIKEIAKNYQIGIHPSYKSNYNENLLKTEKLRLENICKMKIEMSRQHFLVHHFPSTYQNLIKEGIKNDFTLGYTSHIGFRAGIASPFYFYDLSKEKSTDLLLFPFCSMDITPMFYYKLTPEQAIEKNRELLRRVKDVNGTFISLWHNESISGTMRWQGGWQNVYLQLIEDTAKI